MAYRLRFAPLPARPGVVLLALWLLPSMLPGEFLGNHLHGRLRADQVRRSTHVVLAVADQSLMWRAFA